MATMSDYMQYMGKGMTADEIEEAVQSKYRKAKPPFNLFSVSFVIGSNRKYRAKLPPKPVERSRYAQELWTIGAGWNE
jgi:hypothetical protein